MSVRTHARLPEADKSIRLESGDSSSGGGGGGGSCGGSGGVSGGGSGGGGGGRGAAGRRKKELEQRDGQRFGFQGIHYCEQTTITPRGIHSPKS